MSHPFWKRTSIQFTLVILGALVIAALGSSLAIFADPGWNYLPIIMRMWSPPGRLLISEVLYDPLSEEPYGEWIEIYNAGNHPVDLTDYKVGDEEMASGGEGMLQFPPGVSLAPGEVIVIANQSVMFNSLYGSPPDFEMGESDPIIPNMLKYASWAGGNVELVNTGDEVLLLDGYDQVLDAVSWGSSTFAFVPPLPEIAEGHSLERFPADMDTDAATDWIDQVDPRPWQVVTAVPAPSATLGPTPTPTPSGPIPLLVSEVYYDVVGTEPDGEWIEILNTGNALVNLTGFKLGDEETPGGSEGMAQFPDGASLAPGELAVIANKATTFSLTYGFQPDYELSNSDPAVLDMSKYGDWAGGPLNLNNNGDEVLLLSASDDLIDALSWGSSTWAFDPSALDVAEGHSLERRPTFQDTDTAADWGDQPHPQPGEINLSSATPTPTQTITSTVTPTATPTPQPTSTTGLLLISEVLYDPTQNEPDAEWIELCNAGGEAIDLKFYKIGDEEALSGTEGMYQFPPGASIAPGQWIVIANKANIFFSIYGFYPDYEIIDTDPTVSDLSKYSYWASGSLSLHNGDDEVLLLDGDDNLVDAVSWGSSNWAFDPPALDVAQSHSLERYPSNQDTNSAADWIDQFTPNPGTGNFALK